MKQKTILCYGDSNTWGFVPNNAWYSPGVGRTIIPYKRYSRAERWTGRLQHLLSENYYVVEEGLNGRTTNLDYAIPPDRNGKTYLPACLYSHAPIDLVILALGTNDLKVYFNRSAEDIRDGLAELIHIIQTSSYGHDMLTAPNILVLTPAIPLPIAETFQDENGIRIFQGAVKKTEQLIKLYASLAKEKDCHLLDIAKDIIPSEIDGGHLDANAHEKLAAMIANKINAIAK